MRRYRASAKPFHAYLVLLLPAAWFCAAAASASKPGLERRDASRAAAAAVFSCLLLAEMAKPVLRRTVVATVCSVAAAMHLFVQPAQTCARLVV